MLHLTCVCKVIERFGIPFDPQPAKRTQGFSPQQPLPGERKYPTLLVFPSPHPPCAVGTGRTMRGRSGGGDRGQLEGGGNGYRGETAD
jgi:hypothetical protein